MKKLILFDLDGTLLDTLEDLAEAVNHALSLRGLPVLSVDRYRKMVGHGVRNLVQQALEAAVSEAGDGAGKNFFLEGFPKNQFFPADSDADWAGKNYFSQGFAKNQFIPADAERTADAGDGAEDNYFSQGFAKNQFIPADAERTADASDGAEENYFSQGFA